MIESNRRNESRTATRSPDVRFGAGGRTVLHNSFGTFEEQISAAPNIDTQGLFIVASARSGTTIFQHCLNSCADIYLLGEANLALNFWREDFREWYNQMHRSLGNHRSKSTVALDVGNGGDDPARFLIAQSQRFRYVGEKIAFGPHGMYFETTHQEAMLQFHIRFFYRSTYFFMFRRPYSVYTSMKKLLPDKAYA